MKVKSGVKMHKGQFAYFNGIVNKLLNDLYFDAEVYTQIFIEHKKQDSWGRIHFNKTNLYSIWGVLLMENLYEHRKDLLHDVVIG